MYFRPFAYYLLFTDATITIPYHTHLTILGTDSLRMNLFFFFFFRCFARAFSRSFHSLSSRAKWIECFARVYVVRCCISFSPFHFGPWYVIHHAPLGFTVNGTNRMPRKCDMTEHAKRLCDNNFLCNQRMCVCVSLLNSISHQSAL